MMDLDPRRYIRARLADASHKLPFRGRLFGDNQDDPGFEIVDTFPSLDAFLLGDGSIVAAPKEIATVPPAPMPARREAAPTHEE
jgi:hypothetical protein